MLAGKGYKQVYNVAGGIKAWQSQTAVGPQDLGVHLFSGQESAQEVLQTAFSLEQGLESFYTRLADKTQTPQVRDLFLKLSTIEVKHQESIVKAYEGLSEESVTLDQLASMADERAMEGGMTTDEYLALFKPDLESAVDVISLAMSIEAQALDLYQRVGANLTDDQAKKIVLKIADEEKEHLASLGRLMDSL